MGNTNNFEFTGKQRRLFLGLIVVGIALAVIGGLLGDINSTRIWANLLVNSIFFMGIGLLGLFFVATHTMAYGGWYVLVRRIPEAISTFIPYGVAAMFVVVLGTYLGAHHLYHWTDTFIIQEKVTVAELIEYEENLRHHEGHHGDDHHEDDHGDDHGEDHGAEHGSLSVPVLSASLLQDGHSDHQHAEDHHGNDGHGHAQEDGDHGHPAGHHDDEHHGDDAHADNHDDEHHYGHGSHGDDEHYTWWHNQVSEQGDGHHGAHYYADDYKGVAATDSIVNPHFDGLIAHKSGYLNKNFWTGRFLIYAALWIMLGMAIRRASLREDKEGGLKWYDKSRVYSAAYMLIFGVTSAMAFWDYLMSIDTHWFSTMYAWYSTCSIWVATLATTILMVIYLKGQGYLPQVNANHLHDLGKYLFGFSVFWTYLWFSQYMLIWYANLPEETFYYHMRNGDPAYRALFYFNLIANFGVPFLVLVTRGAKRKVRVMTGLAAWLAVTHWLDIFLGVMPGTVGQEWGISALEIGMLMAFVGLFLYVVFNSLSKAPLTPQKHPLYMESVTHTT